MVPVAVDEPRVVHMVPGRIRVHLQRWSGGDQRAIESRIRAIRGVRSAGASSYTRNVLICFDPRAIDEEHLLQAVRSIDLPARSVAGKVKKPPALARRTGENRSRARIAVRGLDRDPEVRKRVADRLQRLPGVLQVTTSPLTGRVLIEFNHHEVELDDLLDEVARVELPQESGEDRPEFPLDPKPLVQSVTRTVGAGLGLALLGARELTGITIPGSIQEPAIRVSSAIDLVQGIPFTRYGVRRLLGRDAADLLVYGSTILSLTLAGNPLGLAVTAAEALRLLTEVVARRRRWRQYEERLLGVASAEPGDIIRVESGERVPLGATVLEGRGTASDRSGMPLRVVPGERVLAGARLYGGPFVVRLHDGPAFTPDMRPVPVAPSHFERYARVLGRISLGYAVLTGLLTTSLEDAFAALLLLSPRTALIGRDTADVGAAARVLREGVTIVGTRPERMVRLPGSLLIDGSRVLTDGFEVAGIDSLQHDLPIADLAEQAGALATAAGSPWSGAIAPTVGGDTPTDATFDGETATGRIAGVPYELGPCKDGEVPDSLRLRSEADCLLVLRRGPQHTPVALIDLQPRLAPGIPQLLDTCHRNGVEIALVPSDMSVATQAVTRRAGIPLVPDSDPIDAIHVRQSDGALVALLSDTADASRAFNACDLAIGLTSGRTSRFPAPADLLAPDLAAVTAIVEAGARRDAAVRDSVGFSIVANLFGAVWGIRSSPGIERASYAVYVTSLAAITDGWARLRGSKRPRSSPIPGHQSHPAPA